MESNEERVHSLAPVWFEEDHLKGETFDQEKYITGLSRYVPLETICTQLDSFLTQLKAKLVEAINAKYNDFVGLAGQLGGAEGAIVRMAKPLMELKKKLSVVERGIESELQLLSITLERRQNVKAARRSLETMQNAIQISSKIDKLMLEVKGIMKEADIAQRSALLERAAREIGRLKLIWKENEKLEIIEGLVQQNASHASQITDHLRTSFLEVIQLRQPDHPSALRLLNACLVVDRSDLGETLIREALLKPMLNEISASVPNRTELRPLVQNLLDGIDHTYGGFLVAARDASAGLQQYDFMGNCVLAAFHEHSAKTMPAVFSPGKPDLFLENFKVSLSLIDQLEARIPTISALERFREGDALKKFMKAWNLQVYFAMRFQEIAGALDIALEGEQMSPRVGEDGFAFRFVSTWIQCLQQCSNPQIVTEHLSDQFTKLFFKLLSRVEHWLQRNIEGMQKKTGTESEKPIPSLPQRNEDLALLVRDLSRARSMLETEFFVVELSDSCKEAVRLVVRGYTGRLHQLQNTILAVIGERLLTDCTAIVKKSVGTAVNTMFRPSGERPTVPNDYVKRLLEPLHFFLESTSMTTLVAEEVKHQIKLRVASGLCRAYRQALIDRLSFWEKSRMSLKRINKDKLAVATGGSDPTSEQKGDEMANVYHQHWLDICAFGKILVELGITDIEEYVELRDLIISKKESQDSSSP